MSKINLKKFSSKTFLSLLLVTGSVAIGSLSSAYAASGEYSFKILEDDENPKISGGGVLINKLMRFMHTAQMQPSTLCTQELADTNALQSELEDAKYGVSQGQVDVARDELSDQIDSTIQACGPDVQEVCRRLKDMTSEDIANDKTVSNPTQAAELCKSLPLKS